MADRNLPRHKAYHGCPKPVVPDCGRWFARVLQKVVTISERVRRAAQQSGRALGCRIARLDRP